ncbi:MAG: ABC-2 type transport system permease protein [Arenicella sp.]|jgi:ABC-2 type transport system permease protein
MSKLGLIIAREYSSRVKKRSFFGLTIVVPVIIVGLAIIALWLGIEDKKHLKVLVSDPIDLTGGKIYTGQAVNPPATFYFTDFMLIEDFEEDAAYEEYDVLIALDPDVITNKTINGVYRNEPSANSQAYIIKKLSSRLDEYFALDEGIDAETFRKIQQPYGIRLDPMRGMEEAQNEFQAKIVGFGFSLLIFIFLLLYSGQVMRSVLEEKTNRVVEIIISSVKPIELMLGKIVAIGLAGLTQFAIWIALITVLLLSSKGYFVEGIGAEVFQNQTADLLFERIPWTELVFIFTLYFILGYVLFASVFATIGAGADSGSDSFQLMLPVIIFLLFIFGISVWLLFGNINGQLALLGSQIPFSSPMIMMQRAAAGTVGVWELVISLIVLAASCIVMVYLSAKVYRVGILMYGKKASWKEIMKWLKH